MRVTAQSFWGTSDLVIQPAAVPRRRRAADHEADRPAALPAGCWRPVTQAAKAYEHITGEEWDRSTRYSYESYSNAAGWSGP
jgi:hypothetical protein